MSRRFVILITFVCLLIAGFVGWALLSARQDTTGTTNTGTGGLGSLFPFGGTGGGIFNTGDTGTTGGSDGGEILETPTPASGPLVKISSRVVAGFGVLAPQEAPAGQTGETPSESSQRVRFAERGTGYIYETGARGEEEKKLTSQLIARTWEAVFADSGTAVALRYLKPDNRTISTFLGRIVKAETEETYTMPGDFLPDNITDITASPDQKSFLYLLETSSGSVGITVKSDGTTRKQIFSSPFTEWLVEWVSGGAIVTTKPSSGIPGYSYAVTTSGNFQKNLGGISGLGVKTSPDGKRVLYNTIQNDTPRLRVRNLGTGSDSNMNLQTFAEKCSWSKDSITVYCAVPTSLPRNTYPDAWYQGLAHFNDAFWKINTSTGVNTQLSAGATMLVDAVVPTLDANENYLFFINKNDRSLWSLDLTSPETPETFPTTRR